MSNNVQNVPRIRFPGFNDAWEQRKLSEVFSILQNNTLSRAELCLEDGVAQNIHYGDVLIKYGEYIDVSCETLPYITNQTLVNKLEGSALKNGDVIMADTAEDETVGKCTEIAGLSGIPVLSGLHTIPLRPTQPFGQGYLGYYMNSPAYHNQLFPLMQGIKVTSVSKGAIQDTVITYPKSIEEQQQIGQLFAKLDNAITLHQRKCDDLKTFKQGMLQKMFPKDGAAVPEIRFPGFTGAWEQRKLSDLFTERHILSTISGEYPRLSFTIEEGVINPEDRKTNKRDFLIKDEDNKKYLITELNDIIYNPANVVYGAIHRNTFGKGCVSPIYRIFSTLQDPVFMGYVVRNERFIKALSHRTEGTVVKLKTLKPEAFLDMQVYVPNEIDEQSKIGKFFETIDNTITLHQRKCDELKEMKKALLQQMFV